MIRYLIKNNFKLIFRNKLAVVVLLLGPVLTIALLSSAFKSMMKAYEAPDGFTVGYRDCSSYMSENMDKIISAGKEAGMTLTEYPDGDPSELITNNDLSAFVEFGDKDYTLYKSGDHKTESMIAEYFIDRVMSEGENTALEKVSPGTKLTSSLPVTKLDFMPAVSSTDYYGIIYIVYFSSLGMIAATGMLGSEKKNGIEKKYQVCSVSSLGLYTARIVPTVCVVVICTAIETAITVMMFGIHWGSPLLSAAVTLLIIIAGCSFGFMLYSFTSNNAVMVIGSFLVIWVMGFLGGSFETYMYSTRPDAVKEISPFYFANRALVELSCSGSSDYVIPSLIFSCSIIIICSAVSVAADRIRKRGKA